MAVTQTIVRMPTTGVELTPLPGDHSPESLVSSLTQFYPELRDSKWEVTYENAGSTKVITFTKRTGEKG